MISKELLLYNYKINKYLAFDFLLQCDLNSKSSYANDNVLQANDSLFFIFVCVVFMSAVGGFKYKFFPFVLYVINNCT